MRRKIRAKHRSYFRQQLLPLVTTNFEMKFTEDKDRIKISVNFSNFLNMCSVWGKCSVVAIIPVSDLHSLDGSVEGLDLVGADSDLAS